MTAVYSGDENFTGSTSNSLTPDRKDYPGEATITPTVSLSVTPNPASVGESVNLFAIVRGSQPVTPVGGVVTFMSGATILGAVYVSSQSAGGSGGTIFVATLTTSFSTPGTDAITATYSGTWELPSTPPVGVTETVHSKTATHFTASATPTSTSAGHTITLRASGLPSTATGTVAFTAGNATLCTATIRRNTTIQCSTSANLAAGSYNVTATYSGDNTYQGSTAATHFTISKATTRFTASASPTRVGSGQAFTISIFGLPANATGRVDITVGPTALVCHVSVTGGKCSIVNTGGTLTYTFTATYEGDNNYLGSSATFRVTVT
jgi:hypothetical protein